MRRPALTVAEAKRQILAKLDRPFKLTEPVAVEGVCLTCGQPWWLENDCPDHRKGE